MGVLVAGVLAVVSVGLMLIDARVHRIPDTITLPACAAAAAFCIAHPAAAWGLIWPGLYLLLALRDPAGTEGNVVGGGDVKLAFPLGVAVAHYAGPLGVIAAVGVSGLVTGVVGAVGRREAIAHGPSMIAAAWLIPLIAHLAG